VNDGGVYWSVYECRGVVFVMELVAKQGGR